MRYRFIDVERVHYPVRVLCRVLTYIPHIAPAFARDYGFIIVAR